MHWCVQVDDVEAALARVEALGAKAVQPLGDWGGAKFVYCYDLDGNVFEMLGLLDGGHGAADDRAVPRRRRRQPP